MSLSTLALRNIQRNFKKYVMYFFSLAFSVFTAYSFLALLQNESVKQKFLTSARYQSMLTAFGIIIMVFVMFFLLSSNKSFIKARKKEISTYALFGMPNRRIGNLLFIEIMIVGGAALVVGLGVGIFFSKLVTMILLDMAMNVYVGNVDFVIYPSGILITIAIFLLFFCLMGLSARWVINKFELVDLFKAEKVAESHSKGSTFLMILSLVLIGGGYYLAARSDPYSVITSVVPILALVIMGTYLFFWSGLPKILHLIKKNKSRYYRASNLIATSGLSHRMRSIGSVMASIAVLSAVATTAIATGFTLYSGIEQNTYDRLGYDMYFYGGQDVVLDEIHAAFEAHGVKIEEELTVQRYVCAPGTEPMRVENSEMVYFADNDLSVRIYSQSIYNKLVANTKHKMSPASISLKEGEAAYSFPFFSDAIEVAVMGKTFEFLDRTVKITSISHADFVGFGAFHTLVVSDDDFDALLISGEIKSMDKTGQPYDMATVINYENALGERELGTELNRILNGRTSSYRLVHNDYNESLQIFGLICFIGYFMSVVFILMTASLLYFKQVMAAEEERHQYRMLRKIGMDEKLEKTTITKRLLPVFFIPLVVGILHSMFAMKSADTLVFHHMISVENSYLTVLAFSGVMYGVYALVYGIFYVITKGQYRRIVK